MREVFRIVGLLLSGIISGQVWGVPENWNVAAVKDWRVRMEAELALGESSMSLSQYIESAHRSDDRIARLSAHLEVIRLTAKAGRVWPDPELRIGYDEDGLRDRQGYELGIRVRLPNKANRDQLKRIEEIDTEWTKNRIAAMRERVAVDLREDFVEAVFARWRLGEGLAYLKELLVYVETLEELKDAALLRAIDESNAKVEFVSQITLVNRLYSEYKREIAEFGRYGEAHDAHVSLVAQADVADWLLPELPEKELVLTLAARSDEAILELIRENGLLEADLESRKGTWIPRPSFAQLEWGETDEDGIGDLADEWGVRAGFSIDLFSSADRERITAVQREGALLYRIALEDTKRRVSAAWEKVKLYVESEQRFQDLWGKGMLQSFVYPIEGVEDLAPLDAWRMKKARYELRTELMDQKQRVYEACLNLEKATGLPVVEFGMQ